MKKTLILSILTISLLLCGCSSKKATAKLDQYFDQMNDFIAESSSLLEHIDELDIYSEDSSAELLQCLDALGEQFHTLSEIQVPEQFSANELLSDEAYLYMNESVRLFHRYYEDLDSGIEVHEAALRNYERAIGRVDYISQILQGKTPEGDGINVYEDDATDFTPVTE